MRPIDADALLNEAEYDSNFRLIIPAEKVKTAPTLTPTNEWVSVEDVLADLARVTAERDAAVEQLHGICSACVNYSPYHNTGKCAFCVYEPAREKDVEANDNWQWRGPKKED